jgi:hypothetical protein
MWTIIITDLFGNEHYHGRLLSCRGGTRAMVRFLKTEHARACLSGTGFTAKEIRCRPALRAAASKVRHGPTLV